MSILRGLPSCICKCILFLAALYIVKVQSGQTVFFSSYYLKKSAQCQLRAPDLSKSSSISFNPCSLAAFGGHNLCLFPGDGIKPFCVKIFCLSPISTCNAVPPLRSTWSTSAPAAIIASISRVSPALRRYDNFPITLETSQELRRLSSI